MVTAFTQCVAQVLAGLKPSKHALMHKVLRNAVSTCLTTPLQDAMIHAKEVCMIRWCASTCDSFVV